MSRSDDYNNDMRNGTFSDNDIELLLSGEIPESPELIELASLVEMLRADGLHTPDETKTQRHSAKAAEMARASRSDQVSADRTPAAVRTRRRLLPRLAGALAAALLLTGLTGVAVASDGAAPGDPLYGIDRALENVGVGAGGAGERLVEASVLANNGKAADGLAHAVEAISQSGNQKAADALRAAAAQLGSLAAESDNVVEVRSSVAAMLNCVADTHTSGASGKDFGQSVSECAAGLTGSAGLAGQGPQGENNGNGPPEGVPPGPPDGVPPVGLGGSGA